MIYFYGVAASGLIAIAYKIPTILGTLYSIFIQAWQISAVTEFGSKDRKRFYSDTFLLTNTVGAMLCAGLLLFNKPLSRVLFQNDFYEAWKYVPFLLLSVMLNQNAEFIGPLLSAKKDSGAIAKAAVWGAISNLLLNIVLIVAIGIQGATIATAISSFIIFIVRWWYARDLLDTSIYKRLYATWTLLLISCIAEVCSATEYIIQIGVLIAILLVNYKQVQKLKDVAFVRFNGKKGER